MAQSGLCGRVSCARFKQRDCGFNAPYGLHCAGFIWNHAYPKDQAEEEPCVKKDKSTK